MFFSEKYNLLFIACPKTGSKSVKKLLLEIDPNGLYNTIEYNGLKITSKDMHYGMVVHARAWEFKNALGDDNYNSLMVFGMVRHPFDRLVSSYFHNKSQSITQVFGWKGEKNLLKRKIKGAISHTLPKILPITIWVFIYNMKSNYDYFFDKKGNRIVKYIGRTDHMTEDLKKVLSIKGIKLESEAPHVNTTSHKSHQKYFKSKWIKNYLSKKYKRDVELYRIAEKEMNSFG
jgi:hypothetical protein